MYGKEMFEKGIYGVKDTNIDKIVYVGSTNTSFVSRWGYHSRDMRTNRHCNKQLTDLINSGNFEFVIIEAGEFDNKELLDKEKYYTDFYDVYENGYCIHVGGGKLQPPDEPYVSERVYKYDNTTNDIRLYIESNWFNKKIYKEDKTTIEEYLISKGIKITQFIAVIKHLGYVIQRYSDKKSWLISEKLY